MASKKMKFYSAILLSFFLASQGAWSALIPTAPQYTLGNRVFTNLSTDATTGLVVLNCSDNAAANTYVTCALIGSSSGYAVPALKSLRIMSAKMWGPNANLAGVDLMYGDNDVAHGTTKPTNPVFLTGFDVGTNAGMLGVISGTAATITEIGQINFLVPTGKFVTVSNNATTWAVVYLYGYLE